MEGTQAVNVVNELKRLGKISSDEAGALEANYIEMQASLPAKENSLSPCRRLDPNRADLRISILGRPRGLFQSATLNDVCLS